MYALECDKFNWIIYNKLPFNEYKEITIPSQLFLPYNYDGYVSNYFGCTSTAINLEKKQLLTPMQSSINYNDVRSEPICLNQNK